jgi:hypothetical protein
LKCCDNLLAHFSWGESASIPAEAYVIKNFFF